MIDRHGSRGDLHEQLRQRLERQNVIQHAQHHDHDRAEQNAADLAVDVGEDERREQKRDENGKPSETGNGRLVHPAVVLRHIDRADAVGQALDQRRGEEGDGGGSGERDQHLQCKLRRQ